MNYLIFANQTCVSVSLQAHSAVRLPPDVPPAQPAAPFSPQPDSSGSHLPLPRLQPRLHALCLHRTGAVPLHPIAVTLRWLPQLHLLPQYTSAHYHSITNPSGCHPSSPSCTHCCVCCTAGLPPLPSAPARPHAVSSSEHGCSCWLDDLKQRDCWLVTSSGWD